MTSPTVPWFHDPHVTGPATHALVIGCSNYPSAAAWGKDAVGPAERAATSALLIARQLRTVPLHRPLASVDLLLSPTPDEAEQEHFDGVDVRRASSLEVSRALESWRTRARGEPDGVSLLYVVGHGVIYGARDHSILLEDLGDAHPVMRGSIDVGAVHAGMAEPGLPRVQFYFVDACRVRSPFLDWYDDAGQGCGLTRRRGLVDDRSAPIFASAAPGSLAWANRATGSLFAQALCEVLESGEAVDDDLWEAGYDTPASFPVTATSLDRPLRRAVERLSRSHGRNQVVTVDGPRHGDAILLRHQQPPRVAVSMSLRPTELAPSCELDIRAVDEPDLVASVRFDEKGQASAALPLGWSSLDLTVPAQLAPHRGWRDERRVVLPGVGGRSWPLATRSEQW